MRRGALRSARGAGRRNRPEPEPEPEEPCALAGVRFDFDSSEVSEEAYTNARTHLSLGKDAPTTRAVEPAAGGELIALPMVGGLHHRYARRAA